MNSSYKIDVYSHGKWNKIAYAINYFGIILCGSKAIHSGKKKRISNTACLRQILGNT